MKKNKKIVPVTILLVLGGCAAAFLCLLVILPGGAHTNPPVVAEPNWDSPRTRELFMRACGDCHSNETVWPWYSNYPPVSWLVGHDVQDGRQRFNVSEWGRGRNRGEESAEAFQEGAMPPFYFSMMHPEAKLTPEERTALLNGLVATFGSGGGVRGGD